MGALYVSTVNSSGKTSTPASASQPAYELLFIGNSHSAANGLPDLVTTLIETGMPGVDADSGLAPGYRFLADRLNDGVTQPMLTSKAWTHVILQAQKYSSTGRYYYPTDAAEEWIRRVKAQNGQPMLFPEWPRRGNTEEGPRIHALHLSIASREPACVAPIGLAWEESLRQYPTLALHAVDGNHSNLTGALLSAYVFYQLLTNLPAQDLPYIPSINVAADVQQNLSVIASTVVQQNQAGCSQLLQSINTNPSSATGIPTLNSWGLLSLALSMTVLGVFKLS